jgi:hypothetical protein
MKLDSNYGWINCRETYANSLELGDVVVQEANIWENPGGLPEAGRVIGKLPHGSKVIVLEERYSADKKSQYVRVSNDKVDGWISNSFVSLKWSAFTFVGNFSPSEVCRGLDVKLVDLGISLLIVDDGFALFTEGDPSHFEHIKKSGIRFVNRVVNALAPFRTLPLQVNFSNWVEVPLDESEGRPKTVGFISLEENERKLLTETDFQTALSIIPLMKISPYFDLALSDFYQALKYPQHALIFLARSIESVEKQFEILAKNSKGRGKEIVMREMLGVKKSDVDYVMKRANKSHRRHASANAKAESLPSDELGQCFNKTASILAAFSGYLQSFT